MISIKKRLIKNLCRTDRLSWPIEKVWFWNIRTVSCLYGFGTNVQQVVNVSISTFFISVVALLSYTSIVHKQNLEIYSHNNKTWIHKIKICMYLFCFKFLISITSTSLSILVRLWSSESKYWTRVTGSDRHSETDGHRNSERSLWTLCIEGIYNWFRCGVEHICKRLASSALRLPVYTSSVDRL